MLLVLLWPFVLLTFSAAESLAAGVELGANVGLVVDMPDTLVLRDSFATAPLLFVVLGLYGCSDSRYSSFIIFATTSLVDLMQVRGGSSLSLGREFVPELAFDASVGKKGVGYTVSG